MKAQSAKAKGRRYQQEVSKLIVDAFSALQRDDVVSRPMGSGGVDLMMSPYAQTLFPFSVECKSTRKMPGSTALNQAYSNRYHGTYPVVAWKPPRQAPRDSIVMLRLVDLIDIAKRLSRC